MDFYARLPPPPACPPPPPWPAIPDRPDRAAVSSEVPTTPGTGSSSAATSRSWDTRGAGALEVRAPPVVLDPQGTILAVNRAWKAVAARQGAAPEACGIGVDHLAVCDHGASDLDREAAAFGEAVRRVLLG